MLTRCVNKIINLQYLQKKSYEVSPYNYLKGNYMTWIYSVYLTARSSLWWALVYEIAYFGKDNTFLIF